MRRIPMLLVVSVLATGCASVPMAPPEMDRVAKEFRTTPGKTNVYVFRDESFGAAWRMGVVLDGQYLGDTAAKTFLVATVAPGPHALMSKAENEDVLNFVAEPGKNVFVWQEVKWGLGQARSRLYPVDEASARARIAECSMALGQAPPPPPPRPVKEPAAIPGS